MSPLIVAIAVPLRLALSEHHADILRWTSISKRSQRRLP